MKYLARNIEKDIFKAIKRGKSVLLFGPRQTGKTTLIKHQIKTDLYLSFMNIETRLRLIKNPLLLLEEIKFLAKEIQRIPLIVFDEVQKLPIALDIAQDLIDEKIAQFIITSSSARKLKKDSQTNLLPGRALIFRLDPLCFNEIPEKERNLKQLLSYGSLPEILLEPDETNKISNLQSYVNIYLEQEVKAEALVRNIGAFARFLELAAEESGNIINFSKLSQEIGVSHTTISEYYQILEDCLITEKISPLLKTKTRRQLNRSSKYIFFDLGVRRFAAGEGNNPPKEIWGHWFEQFVGLEIIHLTRQIYPKISLHYWRDYNGPEIDFIIEKEKQYIPIEVKWTDSPRDKDIRHLKLFLKEYDNVEIAYVVCQTPRKFFLDDKILALPWQEIGSIFEKKSM